VEQALKQKSALRTRIRFVNFESRVPIKALEHGLTSCKLALRDASRGMRALRRRASATKHSMLQRKQATVRHAISGSAAESASGPDKLDGKWLEGAASAASNIRTKDARNASAEQVEESSEANLGHGIARSNRRKHPTHAISRSLARVRSTIPLLQAATDSIRATIRDVSHIDRTRSSIFALDPRPNVIVPNALFEMQA